MLVSWLNLSSQNQSYSVESAHITISSNTGESMWSESIIFGRVCPHHFILEQWGIYVVRINNIWLSLPTSLYPLTLGNLCGQNESYSVESAHITLSSNTGESMWSESIIFGRVCPHKYMLAETSDFCYCIYNIFVE